MATFTAKDTVGAIVAEKPGLSRIFEDFGIDYCCGGKRSIEEACKLKKQKLPEVLEKLNQSAQQGLKDTSLVDAASMTLTDLADHIVSTHHAYLRKEMPRLDAMTEKVAKVHGAKEKNLQAIREVFIELQPEVFSHMLKEEQILFPMVKQLEASEALPVFHCGSVKNPVKQMEHEHDFVGNALKAMRSLSDDYTPPEWACNTYKALFDALEQLEKDFHQHIHKENNVMFPRAIELEKQRRVQN